MFQWIHIEDYTVKKDKKNKMVFKNSGASRDTSVHLDTSVTIIIIFYYYDCYYYYC